jgi:hypothetical protein
MNIHAIEEIKDAAADSRPVLAIRLGRGRTGGTTFLDFLVQRARREGKTIRVADGDRSHATLSEWFRCELSRWRDSRYMDPRLDRARRGKWIGATASRGGNSPPR